MWIKPTKTSYSRIISNYSGTVNTNGEFVFDTFTGFPVNGRAFCFVIGIEGIFHVVSAQNILQLNEWLHVTATYNNGAMSIYINGIEISTGNSGAYTSKPNSLNGISIGEDWIQGLAAEYYQGSKDEVRIWNRAWSIFTQNK